MQDREQSGQPASGFRLPVALMAAAVCVLWGSSFVLTKIALAELGPLGIAWGRWALAAIAFAIYLPLRGYGAEVERALRHDGGAFAWLGLIGITLFYILQNLGLQYSTAVNVGLIINLTSVFIAILGFWWLGEHLDRGIVVSVAISFLGVSLVSLQGGPADLGRRTWLGDGLTLLAALCAAIYSVYGKRIVARYAPVVVTGLTASFGAIFLLPLAIWEGWQRSLSAPVVGALLILGLGSGALANLWWWQVLAQTDATRAGAYLFMIPIVSTALGVAFLGEPFTWMMGVGALLVLGGVVLTQRAGMTKKG